MKGTFIIFDLETTSTDRESAKIVQFAAKKYVDGELDWFSNVIVDPECEIPQEASDVHGITNEQVKEEPPFREYAKDLYARYFSEYDYIVGHNIWGYDIPILQRELDLCNIPLRIPREKVLDTLLIQRKFFGNTLGGLIHFLTGKPMEDAHNAMADITL